MNSEKENGMANPFFEAIYKIIDNRNLVVQTEKRKQIVRTYFSFAF
jgi:hypothetical protein